MAAVWYALIFLVAIALMLWAVRRLDAPGAKERLEIINTLVTTAAIFVGAVWVWDEFSRERKSASRLTIHQDVSSFPIPDDQILLHIQTTFTNAGQTRVSIDKGFTRVQRILPLDHSIDTILNPSHYGKIKTERQIRQELNLNNSLNVVWPLLCRRFWTRNMVIEPNENQMQVEEFILPRSIDLVKIYIYLYSPDNKALGWEAATIYYLKKEGEASNVAGSKVQAGDRHLCNIDPQPTSGVQ